MSIQVYGQFHDFCSFSGVSRAISRMIRQRRMEGMVYGIGQRTPNYINPFLPVGLDNTAGIGLFVGYPELAPAWLQGHEHRILVTVCETDRIPSTWVAACNQMSLVVVPSQWCLDAFRASGVTTEIQIVHHGVDVVGPVRQPRPTWGVTFLHVSGSLSFAGRKGTIPLLRAFKDFTLEYPGVQLWLKVPPTEGYNKVIAALALENNVTILAGESFAPGRMSEVYQGVSAVVQPSRAEGFGMVPLEARCVGVPIILTATTGHAEYFEEAAGDTLISSHGSSYLATQMNPVGNAPLVRAQDILVALRAFVLDQDAPHCTTQWAEQHAREWSWENSLQPLARILKSRYSRQTTTLGAKSSLRGA